MTRDAQEEFTTAAIREWLDRIGAKTLYIEPGSPWEKGYNESPNGKRRNELLNQVIFYTLNEAQILIEHWRREYYMIRPHSALGYRPPAPEAMAVTPRDPGCASPGSLALHDPQANLKFVTIVEGRSSS